MKKKKKLFSLFTFSLCFYPLSLFSIEITQSPRCLEYLNSNRYFSADYSPIRLINFLSRGPQYKETNQGFSFGPYLSLPLQGWKLHISFPKEHAFAVIESVVPFLLKEFPNVAFKIPDSFSFSRGFGNKENSQYGKLITLYPKNTQEFQQISEALKPLLEKIQREHGPFEQPNGKGDISMQTPGLFARYGRFTPSLSLSDNEIVRVDKNGNVLNKNNQIISYKGNPVNLKELDQRIRPLSKEEKEETNEIFNLLRTEGAIEKDDRSQTPSWAKEFIENLFAL